MKLAAVKDNFQTLPSRIVNYTKARPGTGGDLDEPSPNSGAIAGGLQGYVAGGLGVGMAGAIGAYVGTRTGKALDSMPAALGAGAASGAATATAVALGLIAAAHPQLISLGSGTLIAAGAGAVGVGVAMAAQHVDLTSERVKKGAQGLALGAGAAVICSGLLQVAEAVGPSHLLGPALAGGFLGLVGTLSGSRSGEIRDGVYGGMLAGGIAAVLTGNPMLVVAGAAGAGIAGRADTPLERILYGSLAGATAGVIAGISGGQAAMITGAVAGSLIGPVGVLVGPVLRQVLRNATMDATVAVNAKLDPYLKDHPLNHPQKLLLGATMGAVTVGAMGRAAGWTGAGVAAGVGAVGGAIQVERTLRKRAREADETEFLQAASKIAFGQRLDLKTLAPKALAG